MTTLELAAATLEGCFERFEVTAHRIEALRAYDVAFEAEAMAAFREGRPLPEKSARTSPWLARIQQTTAEGKTWSRTRIAGWPLTEYERFEFGYGYPPSINAGEVILVADRTEHPELAAIDRDVWLFDAEGPRPFAALMAYGETGAWLGCEVTDAPDVISRCMEQKQLGERYAIPLAVFLSRHGA